MKPIPIESSFLVLWTWLKAHDLGSPRYQKNLGLVSVNGNKSHLYTNRLQLPSARVKRAFVFSEQRLMQRLLVGQDAEIG